jgi:ubiquinone/menaquinone biosynthesis C-methylase UbiE
MPKSKAGVMKTYDSISESFDIKRYKPWPDTVEFAKIFKKGDLILDIGCGNGRDMRHFESSGLKVVGLDISRGQLEIVRSRATRAPLLAQGELCQLPVKGNSADGAILVATIHHLTNPDDRSLALKEVWRCLKPGGRCLLGVWAREQKKFERHLADAPDILKEFWEPGDILLDWKMPDGKIYKRYYHLFSEQEFKDLLARSEFKVDKIYFSCDNWYALVRKK